MLARNSNDACLICLSYFVLIQLFSLDGAKSKLSETSNNHLSLLRENIRYSVNHQPSGFSILLHRNSTCSTDSFSTPQLHSGVSPNPYSTTDPNPNPELSLKSDDTESAVLMYCCVYNVYVALYTVVCI